MLISSPLALTVRSEHVEKACGRPLRIESKGSPREDASRSTMSCVRSAGGFPRCHGDCTGIVEELEDVDFSVLGGLGKDFSLGVVDSEPG